MKRLIKDKQKLFLSVIAVLTLLVALLGTAFAYFSATVTGNEEASSVEVTTATMGISYINGNEIKMEKLFPGVSSGEKTFTIASMGATVNQPYTINWDIAEFNFQDKSDLVYSLSGTSDKGGMLLAEKIDEPMPTSIGTTAIGDGSLKPEDTHTYSLNVKFKETGSNQNSNQTKTFIGKISVTSDITSNS